jgi:hypothetical protein
MDSNDAHVRILRLDAVAQAVSAGVLLGLGIFVATNWLVLKGGSVVGPNLALLSQFCPGYRVTFFGSLIGFAYGLVYGGLAGFAVSWVYNRIVDATGGRRGGA